MTFKWIRQFFFNPPLQKSLVDPRSEANGAVITLPRGGTLFCFRRYFNVACKGATMVRQELSANFDMFEQLEEMLWSTQVAVSTPSL